MKKQRYTSGLIELGLPKYAIKIMAENDWDYYTFGGENANKLLPALEELYPDGYENFLLSDIADAILSISRTPPIVKKFRCQWSTKHSGGTDEYDTLEEANSAADDILSNWIYQEKSKWGSGVPTEEEIASYNEMIGTCQVSVWEYNQKIGGYELCWSSIGGLDYPGWSRL